MGPDIETAWQKAAACDAHAKQITDAVLRAKFERLRDSWIRIANAAQLVSVETKMTVLVPDERFELPTNGLQNRCSTTELIRQFSLEVPSK